MIFEFTVDIGQWSNVHSPVTGLETCSRVSSVLYGGEILARM